MKDGARVGNVSFRLRGFFDGARSDGGRTSSRGAAMASAASRAFRRALGAAARSAPGAAPKELYALKVDNNGRAWHRAVRIGQGDDGLLRHLLPRDAPLLERTGSFGDTPATLTARPVRRL